MKRILISLAVGGIAALDLAVTATAADASTFIAKPEFHDSGTLTYAAQRPRSLPVLGPTKSSTDSIFLHRVGWSSWGGRDARATARTRQKTYDSWMYVRVRAFRPRSCPSNPPWTSPSTRFYTRVRISGTSPSNGQSWTQTWKAPTCNQTITS